MRRASRGAGHAQFPDLGGASPCGRAHLVGLDQAVDFSICFFYFSESSPLERESERLL